MITEAAAEYIALCNKYARLVRTARRFMWATAILGALLGIAMVVIWMEA
jgi:hypothetical protein